MVSQSLGERDGGGGGRYINPPCIITRGPTIKRHDGHKAYMAL